MITSVARFQNWFWMYQSGSLVETWRCEWTHLRDEERLITTFQRKFGSDDLTFVQRDGKYPVWGSMVWPKRTVSLPRAYQTVLNLQDLPSYAECLELSGFTEHNKNHAYAMIYAWDWLKARNHRICYEFEKFRTV